VHAAVKKGYPLKSSLFLLLARLASKRLRIDTDMLFIITSICGARFTGIDIDDLK